MASFFGANDFGEGRFSALDSFPIDASGTVRFTATAEATAENLIFVTSRGQITVTSAALARFLWAKLPGACDEPEIWSPLMGRVCCRQPSSV